MTLREKLAEKNRQQSAARLRKKLASVPGLGVGGFDDNPELLPPQQLWRRFTSYERDPEHRIPDEAFADSGASILKQWLDSLAHPKALHLSIAGHGDLAWLRVTPSDSFSLFDLFNIVGDFIALDAKSGRAIGVMDDEHEKLVFKEPQLGRDKS